MSFKQVCIFSVGNVQAALYHKIKVNGDQLLSNSKNVITLV